MINRKTKRNILLGFDIVAIVASGVISYIFLEPYVFLPRQDVC